MISSVNGAYFAKSFSDEEIVTYYILTANKELSFFQEPKREKLSQIKTNN